MTKVCDYFKAKYDKNGPAYLEGVLRTINKLPGEEKPDIPLEEILEK